MKSYDYFHFVVKLDPVGASIVNISERVDNHHKLREGLRMGESFPADTVLDIFENTGDMLFDFIGNISRVAIISSRVKGLFEAEGLDDASVEYLPFILKDKKGRVVEKQYFVANALVKIDCLDHERSWYKTDSDEATVVEDVSRLHLLKEEIPEEAKLFRLGEFPQLIIIRSDLLARLRKEGITGVSVQIID